MSLALIIGESAWLAKKNLCEGKISILSQLAKKYCVKVKNCMQVALCMKKRHHGMSKL
jgi:hypothetical protein